MNTVNRIGFSFSKRASKNLSDLRSLTSVREEELADQLFNIFESICTTTSYDEGSERTWDRNTADNEYNRSKEERDTQTQDAE